MTVGTVKFFNPDKGFGFIVRHDGGEDVFVHVSAVEQSGLTTLNGGDEVSFEVQGEPALGQGGGGGYRGYRVRLAGHQAS